jgi:hypothetical protein
MRLKFCAACGETEELIHHYLVEPSDGGADDETNQITSCFPCFVKLRGEKKVLEQEDAA